MKEVWRGYHDKARRTDNKDLSGRRLSGGKDEPHKKVRFR